MAVVLVVEDDSDLLGVLAEALAEEGWSVFSSASAAGAIERARSLNMGVDVVLCDLLLASGEDGVALEAAFRADSALQGVPFVFMTGSSKVGAPPESRARVLFKPFDVEQAVAALESCLPTPRPTTRRPPRRVAPDRPPQEVEIKSVEGRIARRR